MRRYFPFVVFTIIVIFSACRVVQRPLINNVPQNNPSYKIDYLFEHDGCKVYRFQDNGNYIYFTNCRGEITNIINDSINTRITNRVLE